jgi:hypothetical protein
MSNTQRNQFQDALKKTKRTSSKKKSNITTGSEEISTPNIETITEQSTSTETITSSEPVSPVSVVTEPVAESKPHAIFIHQYETNDPEYQLNVIVINDNGDVTQGGTTQRFVKIKSLTPEQFLEGHRLREEICTQLKDKEFDTAVRPLNQNQIQLLKPLKNGSVSTIKMNLRNEYLIEVHQSHMFRVEEHSFINRETLNQLKNGWNKLYWKQRIDKIPIYSL